MFYFTLINKVTRLGSIKKCLHSNVLSASKWSITGVSSTNQTQPQSLVFLLYIKFLNIIIPSEFHRWLEITFYALFSVLLHNLIVIDFKPYHEKTC